MIQKTALAGLMAVACVLSSAGLDGPKTGAFEEVDAATKVAVAYYVPPDYNAKETYYIVVAHHGVGHDGAKWRDHLIAQKGPKNWIYICPTNDGLKAGNVSLTLKDADRVADASKTAVEKIMNEYSVDKKHVLTLGYSGGGHTVAKCWAKYPDLFTAMALCSCNFSTSASAKGNGRPVIVISGEKDLPNIIRDAGIYERTLKEAGAVAKVVKIPSGKHWVGEAVLKEVAEWWEKDGVKGSK